MLCYNERRLTTSKIPPAFWATEVEVGSGCCSVQPPSSVPQSDAAGSGKGCAASASNCAMNGWWVISRKTSSWATLCFLTILSVIGTALMLTKSNIWSVRTLSSEQRQGEFDENSDNGFEARKSWLPPCFNRVSSAFRTICKSVWATLPFEIE